ncbi:hypothetical protein GCK72_021328 [Caenorhabditis remanei]|uniref:PAN-3 domain-containing protein n=1 Tax=Caenorhabditis remanei TaxID=31234 RepID=A0A6A5GIZ2_CAERE|nr:hypothetical protein GCK72_021328 [Caenorhabditis remanei]KAF1754764.1 hypothetical protein GCK72_021328 [Caenorhabditis remanei]
MFLKVLFIFLIILEATGEDTTKMLKIFGKVSNVSLNATMVDTNCMATCFTQDDCFLAYFNLQDHCQLFSFNATESIEVVETTKAEGLFVAFKTTLPNDTCPAYDSMIPVVNIGEDSVSWKRSEKTFSFQKCRGDWKMFNRTGLTVCMQVFLLNPGISRVEAMEYCESINTTLTGVAMIEESEWLQDRFKKLDPGAPGWSGVWMDGIRNCTGFKVANCRNFDWSDGYTEGQDALASSSNAYLSYRTDGGIIENCLQVFIIDAPQTINDVECDHAGRLDRGAVCGYRLN